MTERSFDKMISYFNHRVADMDINQDYKMELLGMITALGFKHEKLAQQWIPCSERLPETHKAGDSVIGIFMQSKPVLVYGVPEYESEYSFNVVTYCDDLDGITYWSTDAVTINKVTAWMPLPEPYKERQADK